MEPNEMEFELRGAVLRKLLEAPVTWQWPWPGSSRACVDEKCLEHF
jgi:hypothetical protein